MRIWIWWPVLIALLIVVPSRSRANDCNNNGLDDTAEIATGTASDCNANGVPDECDVAPVNFGFAPVIRLPVANPISPAGQSGPVAAIAADLDGDGTADIATTSIYTDEAVLFLNRGDGTFESARRFPVRREPVQVAAADFNGDRQADLVVLNAGSNEVSILLNSGSGTFLDSVNFPVETTGRLSRLSVVAADDFDGDGRADLVLACTGGGAVEWLGLGEDGFGAGAQLRALRQPVSLTIGDWDSDGDLDLAVAGAESLITSIRWNRGDGFFRGSSSLLAAGTARDLVAADLNGDGAPDLIRTNAWAPPRVCIRVNDGRGFFPTLLAREFAAGPAPHQISVADFDNDGMPDVVTTQAGLARITFLRGLGDAALAPPASYPVDAPMAAIDAADFDRDGQLDLVAAHPDLAMVAILRNQPVPLSPDCNGNGIADECDISDGRSADCNENDVPDACDLATGIIPDCDGNGNPDECDVRDGLSLDCNGNGVPDVCDVAAGTSVDCNENGLLDECELRDRTAFDVDFNDRLDECDGGDFDKDGDTDLADFLAFAACFRGPRATPFFSRCAFFDRDHDGDADLADFVVFQAAFTGAR